MLESAMNGSLLDDVKVLEIADEKGLHGGKMLADMGAQVIKLERTGGDPSRNIGPFYKDTPNPEKSLYWWYYNRSKKSITLNLENGEGRDIFKRLIKEVDIFIETPPPDTKEGVGMGYGALTELNPRLIMACITNFGRKGPHSHYKAPDLIGVAMGGMMAITGDPERPPVKPYGELAYYTAANYAAVAALIALNHRDVTGKGQFIDIPMQACVATCLEYAFPFYAYHNTSLKRMGSRLHTLGPGKTGCCYPCKDGHVWALPMAPPLDWMEEEGMVEDLKEDEMLWLDWIYRTSKEEHIQDVFGRFIETHTRDEIFDGCRKHRSVWTPIRTIDEAAEDPHLRERGFFTEIEQPNVAEKVPHPRRPTRISDVPDRLDPAPGIGEHNEEIYQGLLKLSEEELSGLAEAGII